VVRGELRKSCGPIQSVTTGHRDDCVRPERAKQPFNRVPDLFGGEQSTHRSDL
jgi:hypothetical protein